MICTLSEFVLKIIGKRCSVGKKKLAVLFIAQHKVVRIKLCFDISQREALAIGCFIYLRSKQRKSVKAQLIPTLCKKFVLRVYGKGGQHFTIVTE